MITKEVKRYKRGANSYNYRIDLAKKDNLDKGDKVYIYTEEELIAIDKTNKKNLQDLQQLKEDNKTKISIDEINKYKTNENKLKEELQHITTAKEELIHKHKQQLKKANDNIDNQLKTINQLKKTNENITINNNKLIQDKKSLEALNNQQLQDLNNLKLENKKNLQDIQQLQHETNNIKETNKQLKIDYDKRVKELNQDKENIKDSLDKQLSEYKHIIETNSRELSDIREDNRQLREETKELKLSSEDYLKTIAGQQIIITKYKSQGLIDRLLNREVSLDKEELKTIGSHEVLIKESKSN